MPYAIGWKKDKHDGRDHDATKTLLKAAPPPPPSADNHDLVKVVDQGGLGSCVVNATGQAMRAAELVELVDKAREEWAADGDDPGTFDEAAALARANADTEFWSRLFAYYLARAYDHDTANDDGTEIRLCFQAVSKYGFPPESAWPYSDANPGPFSRIPPANVFRLAFDQRVGSTGPNQNMIDYARITSTAAERVVDIKTAIAQRHLVVFGTLVTNGFCSDGAGNGGAPIPCPSSAVHDVAGGHALCVVGYDAAGAVIVNSWGTAYGGRGGLPAGCCKFAWSYMTWAETTDLWIVRRSPLLPAKGA